MKSDELHRHYTLAMNVVDSVVVVVSIVVVVVAVAIGVPNYLMMLVVVVVVAPSMVLMLCLVAVVVVLVGPNLLLLCLGPSLLLLPTHHLAHTSPCLFLVCLFLFLFLSFLLPMSYLFLPTVLDPCLCPFPGACLLLYWYTPFLYALSRYIPHIVPLFPLLPRPRVMRTHVKSVHLLYNYDTCHHLCPCLFPSEKHQGHGDLVPMSLARLGATNPVHLDLAYGLRR